MKTVDHDLGFVSLIETPSTPHPAREAADDNLAGRPLDAANAESDCRALDAQIDECRAEIGLLLRRMASLQLEREFLMEKVGRLQSEIASIREEACPRNQETMPAPQVISQPASAAPGDSRNGPVFLHGVL
ncbi:MAG TPA: hypothetical protein VNO70_19265 [Blastocatellia bacterium]|nr:hypothetical protein [Blastocatellia bacterium]